MRRILGLIFITVCAVYLVSCNGCSDKKDKLTNKSFAELVSIWNEANSKKDVATLSAMYDSVVHFYQYKYTLQECIDSKNKYFEKHPQFIQTIEGQVFADTLSEGVVRVNFTKQVVLEDEIKSVPAYLIFKNYNGVWKISAESDLETDRILQSSGQIPSNAVEGDYNGDGILDYMWLEIPENPKEICRIRFSGPIPPIIVNTCMGGNPVNEGDLNLDGKDEVGILPVWESSCWMGYFVYTFKNNQWVELIEPVSTHCMQWEKEIAPIVKDTVNEGYIFVNYSELTDNGIEVKTKSVKVIEE